MEENSRQALVDHLYPWWRAWAEHWIVNIHGAGFCNLYNDIRTAKGTISHETVEAIKAAILEKDKNKGLVQILISNHPPSAPFDYTTVQGGSNVENCGCVWGGTIESEMLLSTDSIADIIYWVIDCDQYMDDSAFLEPSGYIYHLDRRARRESIIPLTSPVPASESNSEGSSFLSSPSALFSNIPHAAASAANTVAKGSLDGLTNLMYYSTFGFLNINKTPSPELPATEGPADDLNDSRFLVGFEGALDEDPENNLPSSAGLNSPDFLPSQVGDDGDDDEQNATLEATFSYKRLLLSLDDSPNVFEPYNVIIFRRRPFIFTLIFKSQSPVLSNKSYYFSLYRRLASLTEPIYADLNAAAIKKEHRHKKHYHPQPQGHSPSPTPSHSRATQLTPSSLSYAPPLPTSVLSITLAPANTLPSTASPPSSSLPSHQITSTTSPSQSQSQTNFHPSITSNKKKKFYYLVHDPHNHIVQYSLPEIISYQTLFQIAAEIEGGEEDPEFQHALFKRDELIHVHQVMTHISLSRHKSETEKFIRTAKGWWIYWARLPDKREVVVARKWNKPGKPPSDPINGLLSALGNDANTWLNEYRNYGRV